MICESLVRAPLTGVPVKLNMLGSTPSAIKVAWRCRMRFSCAAIRRRCEGEEEGEEGHKVGHAVGQGLGLTCLCEVSFTPRTRRTVAGDLGGRTGSVARSSLRPREAIAKERRAAAVTATHPRIANIQCHMLLPTGAVRVKSVLQHATIVSKEAHHRPLMPGYLRATTG